MGSGPFLFPCVMLGAGYQSRNFAGFRGLAPRQTHPPTLGLSVIMSMINIIRHMCTRCSSICTRCVPAPTHSFKVHWGCLVEKPKVVCFHCAFRVPFSAQGKVEGVAVDAKVEGVGHTPSSTVIAFVCGHTPLSTIARLCLRRRQSLSLRRRQRRVIADKGVRPQTKACDRRRETRRSVHSAV